ncbi:MAG: biotin--[acetyl-CoA-carboxylase] ligase [Bryobacterales bacterium]|nr:biotin--[acetyl-CoA-carboxylase] ligase [Bryobacterales bacterium]
MALDIASVRRALPGRRIEYFETVDTTMRVAAAVGQPGTIVVANEQTAGQGRHGHVWHSAPDEGLYVSIVLGRTMAACDLPPATLALGLATAEAIARVTDLGCDLRWPNDVMLEERKAAGILVQAGDAVVAGIGINANHAVFPETLAGEATSLRLATGQEVSREELLFELIRASDAFLAMLRVAGKRAIFDQFMRRSSYARGRRVQVARGNEWTHGVTEGLDGAGFLVVRRDDGARETIYTGGVRALSA